MDDFREIQTLICRYSDLLNRRDWDGLPGIFTSDAHWEIIGTEYCFDGDGVPQGLRAIVEPTSFIMQNISPAIIDIDGGDATARSSIHEVVEVPALGKGFNVFGVYEDKLRKVDGQWRFASRRFNQMKTVAAPLEAAAA